MWNQRNLKINLDKKRVKKNKKIIKTLESWEIYQIDWILIEFDGSKDVKI